jgi:Nif-specific regulatory protein
VDKRYHLVPGTSGKFDHATSAAKKAAASNSTVLLLGESGTGKELFARAIHNWSERKERAFVAINCVGLAKELLESELFGYERGAFTGAQQRKRGKLELAQNGTVFLDEVGDMSEEIQTKLLRFLQEREFERVGGTEVIRVDVRIIAATNRDLEKAVQTGQFRADLFYRLNVVPIVLPPLRERKEDIPPLVRYFVQRFGRESKKNFTDVSQAALEKLLANDWPGNVRELANVLERAVVLGQPPMIELDDLPETIVILKSDHRSPSGKSYYEMIEDCRRQVISAALAQTQGNQAAAARILGLQRTYLSRLVKSLRIR